MEQPNYKDYTRPFDGKLVLFDSKKYSKDMKKYVDFLHSEILTAFEFLHDSGVNLGDKGDQCYQILFSLKKQIQKR